MSSFPELLYVPADSDVLKAITVPARFAWDEDDNLAQVVIAQTSVTVPRDRVLRVTHLSVLGIPGAGQLWTDIELFAQNELATFAHRIYQDTNIAGQAQKGVNVDLDCTLMPEERLQLRATFNAGGAANRVITSVWGWMYPRANIQHAPV